MKKIFVLFFLIQSSHFGWSQTPGLRIGAHFGIGEATIREAEIKNQTGKLALQAGLGMNYQFSRNIGLYSNILFTHKGSRSSGTERVSGFFGSTDYNYEEDYTLNYIEIPLMPKLSLGGETFFLKVFAGPSINFNVSGKQDKVFEDSDYNKGYGYTEKEITGLELVEFSLVAGGGFDVELADESVLFLEVRQSMGLNSFGKINALDAYNQYFAVGLGFLYKY